MFRWRIKTRRGELDAQRVRAIWSRFGRHLKPHVGAMAIAFASALVVVAMQIAAPWPIKIIFDLVLSDQMKGSWLGQTMSSIAGSPSAILGWVCAAILLIAVLDAVFTYFRDILLAQTGQRVVGKIRQDLFRHLQTLPPSVFERQRTGALLMRLTGDIQMLRQMLINAVLQAGQSGLTVVAMIAAMFWLNPVLALLGVATIPVTFWASWRISRQIHKATKSQREKESQVASIAHDVIGAMSVIQAFNREETERKRFARQNRASMRSGVKTTRLESKLYRIISIAAALGVCAILYVGVHSVLKGVMTAGDLLVFISYLRALNKPMRQMAKISGQVAKATACGERVAELYAIEPAVRDRPDARVIEEVKGEVSFEQVSFAYDDEIQALTGLDLHVAAGQRVAIVGHTGAGKSTLMKLLLRFFDPPDGCVRIDGNDIRELTLDSLRRCIGWVHQDTLLFGMTVSENISLGKPDADAAAIEEIARRVHADDFIRALPGGYDTVLGEGGQTLSGGQRQRLALARALLRQPAILLLDEPATGLDGPTRRLVEEAWMSQDNRATTLVICHRMVDMHRFDRIFVLSAGRLCESGTHTDLLAANGEYATLFHAGGEIGSEEPVESASC